jgi:phage terminase large subunit-like protein
MKKNTKKNPVKNKTKTKTIVKKKKLEKISQAKSKKLKTRAELAISFIHKYCKVPEGDFVGMPFVLDEFQIKFITDVLDNPAGTKKAILSMAKKNGKTSLIAALVLVFVVGPEAKRNTQIVSGAMSKDQAALVYDACVKMIELEPELQKVTKVIDSKKILWGLPRNVKYRALAAEGKTTHGISPVVIIFDELGEVQGPSDEFFDALETSQGAYADGMMIIISTQAATDADLLSITIDDALAGDNPKIVCHLYAAPEGCKLLDEKAWHAANPALGKFRSIEDVRGLALGAMSMPSKENAFRNKILNQRVTKYSPYIPSTVWKANSDIPIPMSECDDVFGGLDLSGRTALTALVFLGRKGIKRHAYPYFWTPAEGIEEREKHDRAPYRLWVKEGYLRTCPGATIDLDFIAKEILEIINEIPNLVTIGFDRWNIQYLKAAFARLGLEEPPLTEWGQGFKDMTPAINEVENIVLNKNLAHGNNPVLNMCHLVAKIVTDPAEGKKLDKAKSNGRIDGAQAMAMAAGVSIRQPLEEEGDFDAFLANPVIL